MLCEGHSGALVAHLTKRALNVAIYKQTAAIIRDRSAAAPIFMRRETKTRIDARLYVARYDGIRAVIVIVIVSHLA